MKLAFSLSYLVLTFFKHQTVAHSNCGDWQPFGHSKCFKVFDEVGSYEEAEATCIKNSKQLTTLATIKSAEEQAFLERYIQEEIGFVQSVWLGAKFNYTTKKFQWNDNSELKYHNWAASNPKNKSEDTAKFGCVQMNAEQENLFKWSNQECSKNNVPVCQKMQTYSMDDVNLMIKNIWEEMEKIKQKSVETNNQLKETGKKIDELEESSSSLSTELISIKRNPVPVGFIYVQLPNQPAPGDIWPNNVWTDSSDQFAGVFFRVFGGGSAAFGNVQQEFSPRIINAKTLWVDDTLTDSSPEFTNLNKAATDGIIEESVSIWTALSYWENWALTRGLKFKFQNGEVRPKNTAVKIWKRTA